MTNILDKRIKKIIKLCIKRNHRSLFIILGAEGCKKIPVFVQLLRQRKIKDLAWLWCCEGSSNEFDIKNKANLSAFQELEEDGEMDEIPSPCYCSYDKVDKITHRSFNLAILQDFKALSLQNFSRIIELVKGGGVIIFLFQDMMTVDDLMELNLNVEHKPSRFCKRFAASLLSHHDSMILDENLSVLSSGAKFVENQEESSLKIRRIKLEEIKQKHESDDVIKNLLTVCHTHEQAELLVNLLEVIKKKTLHSICSVSSPVGRGKSATLGLAIAGSLAYNYSNIFISSMSYNNVHSVFKFLLLGLDALNYKEDSDFDLIKSVNPKLKDALIGLNVFKDHPQSIRFIFPCDIGKKLDQAELVVFDEASAIPLQILKPLFGPYVVFMASSTSGPGATSSFLYSSMIDSIQPAFSLPHESNKFQKYILEEPIYYSSGDSTELWMNQVLQTELATTSLLSCGFPVPDQCNLFCINRDVLFNGSNQAESFLKALMAILSSSSRKINPDHLLKLADSPKYEIFCLLAPINTSRPSPEVICASVVHLENEIPDQIFHCGSNVNESVSHCFNEWKVAFEISPPKFLQIQGIHIVNIVTHKSYRKMGYGMRTIQLLQEFYEGKCISLDENVEKHCKIQENSFQPISAVSESPLLQQLTEVQPEHVDYILVTCGLTPATLKFWRKAAFVPAYLTETANFEGEHTLFMIKSITDSFQERVEKIWYIFQKNFFVLLGSAFKYFPAALALNLVHFSVDSITRKLKGLTKEDIDVLIRPHRMKSLVKYAQNLQEFHSVIQFIPILSTLYFKNTFKDVALSRVQEAILLSFGLQFKVAEEVGKDLGLPNMQIYGLLNRTIKKLVKYLNDILEKSVEKMLENPEVVMEPIAEDLEEELEEAAKKIQHQQEMDAKKLLEIDVSQYAIKGSEDDWQKALFSGRKTLVSIKSIKKSDDSAEAFVDKQPNLKKNKKQKRQRR